jgi:transcription initiation factor TFIIIB Brf1 subunit/transcription initiation factor TFIIB
MVYLKGCPRCRGDLFVEHDLRDHYITCLQCGHVLSQREEFVLQVRSREWVVTRPVHDPRAA